MRETMPFYGVQVDRMVPEPGRAPLKFKCAGFQSISSGLLALIGGG